MRGITQHVERSSQEQARGGRQITQTIESIAGMVSQLNSAQRVQSRSNDTVLASVSRIDELARSQQRMVAHLQTLAQKLAQRVEK
jgi:methyl-accepting chemotaxis protein